MRARGDLLYATAMTVGEILVKPVERSDQQVQRQYLEFFRSGAVQILPFDLNAAVHYGLIRTDRSIKPPDAIQLACGAAEGMDLFITNDDRLAGKVVAGVNFISALESAPL